VTRAWLKDECLQRDSGRPRQPVHRLLNREGVVNLMPATVWRCGYCRSDYSCSGRIRMVMRVTGPVARIMRFACGLTDSRGDRNADNDENQGEGKASSHDGASIAKYSAQG